MGFHKGVMNSNCGKFAGKKVINYETNEELSYNKEDMLNPWFVVK